MLLIQLQHATGLRVPKPLYRHAQTSNNRHSMNKTATFLTLAILALTACSNPDKGTTASSACDDNCKARNNANELSCKLATPELQRRKETVIASLKQQVLEKKELEDGYAFRFPGTDEVLDELAEFIKTERACCSFFTFGLSVSGDKGETWLELTGIEGSKNFITAELGL